MKPRGDWLTATRLMTSRQHRRGGVPPRRLTQQAAKLAVLHYADQSWLDH